MWGGSVRDIGGRDRLVVRGAGVDSVLHTVRIAVMTHAGASGMTVEPERPFGRSGATLRADLVGDSSLSATLKLLFSGDVLDGEF